MAYDNSAYQPPSRAYYPQSRHQAPAQQSYRGQSEPVYDEPASGWDQQGCSQQAYANGYVEEPTQYWEEPVRSPDYGRRPERGHPQPRPQQQQSHSQYQVQPNQPRSQSQPQSQPQPHYHSQINGYAQEQERYDPRYQQRQGRAAPQSHVQSPGARAQPPYDQQSRAAPRVQTPQDRQGYQMPPASEPPYQAQYESRQQSQQRTDGTSHHAPMREPMYAQQSAEPVAAPRKPEMASAPKQSMPPPQKPAEPRKMTMEEWKAKEKSKLHNDALSPETLPQDNAFPTFPVKKKERADRSDGASFVGHRSSEEQTRSSTPNSARPHHKHAAVDPRPGIASRDNSYDRDPPRQNGQLEPQPRPSIDHKPFSFEPLQQRPDRSQPSTQPQKQLSYERRPSEPRQPANGLVRSPERECHEPQWPTSDPQGSQVIPPRQQRGSPSRSATASKLPPSVLPINTRQAQRPVFANHQPLSPANVPPRPSTTEGARSPHVAQSQDRSPLSQFSYSQTPQDYSAETATRWPPSQQHKVPHARHDTVDSLVNGYSDITPLRAPQRTRTRDEEIEEDMPDFDSAAPSQTSLLQKRKKSAERPPAAMVPSALVGLPAQVRPSQQASTSSQSVPTQKTRFYGGQPQSDPYQNVAVQKQKYAASATEGFDFGVANGAAQEPPQEPMYQDQRIAYQQAYAREPTLRRSMDESRQMPYRGAPQGQRFAPNGQYAPDQYPPQHRTEVDRNFSAQIVDTMHSAQTMWSDPGQRPVSGGMPPRQALPVSPGSVPNGAPLTQQRSAPEERQRQGNPDALPQHPVPIRPGLMEHGGQQPGKPPPVRNYDSTSSQQRKASLELSSTPVTTQELDRLRAAVDANPTNNKQALLLAKKLVEASTVLASEGGRADPRTTAKNRERYVLDAHKRIRKLVSSGYSEAQFYLADCYGQGSLGLEVDTKEAFNLYQAAAKAGHPQAAYRTAVCCEMGAEEGGGTRRDYAKALQWYTRAAALGDSAAMYKLGVSKLKALLGSPRNVGEAVTWLKRAAERADKENPHALHELATLYEPANTNPELRNKLIADEGYARELFQQAAALGYKFSQLRLGQAYEYGTLGLQIDNRASIAWYSKAAAQGEHQAELALSGWYLTGAEGILEHSDTEAYLWARKAASSEPPLAKAMFAMGYFSEMGIGCPQSIEDARRWYGRAASFKFPKALERLEELKRSGKHNRPAPVNGKLSRKDQKRDEAECAVM